ncbi:MAG TPA: TIM barrel protein [Candidatus Acidoferrum sp.]|nr:TIM barrel protein [Candidatus Acidoferrum sp.]
MSISVSRRKLLAAAAASAAFAPLVKAAEQAKAAPIRQGRLKQSVMATVWGRDSPFNFVQRCEILSMLGFQGVDLVQPDQVPILTDHGLAPALMVAGGTSFNDGLIRKELHDKIVDATHESIDMAVRVGCPTLISMPGNRRGMSHEEAADHAIEVLKRIAPYAEQKGITLCTEITNSKVAADQRTDQAFDDINWGIKVCRAVASPRIKILYDIYHVQISNGDVVRTLKDNFDLCAHFHVAGVPSRAEIDDGQELNFHWIAKQIADLNYQGYIAHEWRPSPGRNPLLSLATCFDILVV